MIFLLLTTSLLYQVENLSVSENHTPCFNGPLAQFEHPTYIRGEDIIYINRAIEQINNQYKVIQNIEEYNITVNKFEDVFMVSIYHNMNENQSYHNDFMYRAVIHFEINSSDAPSVVFYQTIGDLWADANAAGTRE